MPARDVKLMLFDVDGVLTDGRIHFLDALGEAKAFSALDGCGLNYLRRAGIESGLVSARVSVSAARRARALGMRHLYLGVTRKLDALPAVLAESGLAAGEIGFMGDDLTDLPLLRAVGFSAAPANARPEVRAAVEFVAKAAGGFGAAREVIEHLLKRQGKWPAILARYEDLGTQYLTPES